MGKTSRRKGSSYERVIAQILQEIWGEEFRRTPLSGGWSKKKVTGDIVPVSRSKNNFPFSVECKNRKTLAVPAWLKQAKDDCPKNQIPLLVFHVARETEEYTCLNLRDFACLVKEFVTKSREYIDGYGYKESKLEVKTNGNT